MDLTQLWRAYKDQLGRKSSAEGDAWGRSAWPLQGEMQESTERECIGPGICLMEDGLFGEKGSFVGLLFFFPVAMGLDATKSPSESCRPLKLFNGCS